MADRPRFGPAGVPPTFRLMKAAVYEVPELLRAEGLDAFEYEAVRWGKKPQIKQQLAERLGVEAEKSDVWLSMHGSYFINLCGKQEILEDSKKRLTACATAAGWMKAHVVVFHQGFYSQRSHRQDYATCRQALLEVVAGLRGSGITEVRLGLETSGKLSQFGTLNEILGLCEEVDQTQPVLDWSHLHAIGHGRFVGSKDFADVLLEIESRLGAEAVRNVHCHFSKIEFTWKGERRHHVLDEKRYGPDFRTLAQVLIQFQAKPVVICETALQDIDAIKMRDIYREQSLQR